MLNHKLKSLLKSFLLLLGLLLLLVFAGILYSVTQTDYSSEIPQENTCLSKTTFNLKRRLHAIDAVALRENFPYQAYVDSADVCDINAIGRDLALLDSVNAQDPALNRELILTALTTELERKIAPSVITYNPDSLILLLQWAGRFNYYKDIDKKNARLFKITHRHWLNFIANKAGEFYDKHPAIKHDFKFKYLVAGLKAKNYTPAIGNTQDEKVVNYFIESKYMYLFNRYWNGTGFLFKLAGMLLTFIVFYGFYCILKIHVLK